MARSCPSRARSAATWRRISSMAAWAFSPSCVSSSCREARACRRALCSSCRSAHPDWVAAHTSPWRAASALSSRCICATSASRSSKARSRRASTSCRCRSLSAAAFSAASTAFHASFSTRVCTDAMASAEACTMEARLVSSRDSLLICPMAASWARWRSVVSAMARSCLCSRAAMVASCTLRISAASCVRRRLARASSASAVASARPLSSVAACLAASRAASWFFSWALRADSRRALA
mmetsp:Transcript_15549/g.52495  ORF Transcript_15549/g.52495 Transcript_15549/m.52495 type:complete len:238 (-) Transcript_15549:129-842(-)